MRRFLGITATMALALTCLALATLGAAAQDGSRSGDSGSVNAALAAYGKSVYRVYCASCHGDQGDGEGRLAEYLTIKPANLSTITKRNDGEFPTQRIHDIIDGRNSVRGHGGEMPVWGDAFQKADALDAQPPEVREEEVDRKIDSLVHFLKSIQEE